MVSRFLVPVVVAALLTVSTAQAQILQLGAPANYPPASFSGQQFVDNDGCVYLRAGFGGTVNWVPRVNASHQPLCNYPPSFGTAVAAAVAANTAPGPVAAAPAAPAPLFAKPYVGDPIRLVPVRPARQVIAAPAVQPVVTPQITAIQSTSAIPRPPKGYRMAWKDDRLNPLRGLGTAAGQAQQDQIWTRHVPAKLIPQVRASNTSVSTMSSPARALFVQIGTFGQPANAARAKAGLTALGLPIATSSITRKGHMLQVVYAGPFASPTQAQSALATTLGAGFTDAILK